MFSLETKNPPLWAGVVVFNPKKQSQDAINKKPATRAGLTNGTNQIAIS